MKNVYWFGSRVFFSMALALTGLLMTAALSSAADSDCKKIEESPGTWACLNVLCDNMFYTCKSTWVSQAASAYAGSGLTLLAHFRLPEAEADQLK